eukprot:gnl/MRDRNA2_/MRDRNA2_29891_c0_seq1.p1 gnl/MRDRNA2_/MRDRNA2_29891_c0~~gnl/MRDRNA2_/MRDRNA2_29891_c0_seq1.p1  ORF type:complete len:662 (+),score=131.11 gnl/MRDRNA2_/MRDRNA2_29891_c0_seq1:263-1987(+)
MPNPSDPSMQQLIMQLTDPTWRFKHTGQKMMTGAERKELKESQRNTYRPRVQPAWLKHARQVLRFEGYFQEKVEENAHENCRFRHCQIMYFLEDGTMQVNEPKVENSGIPQGAFIKRHVIPHVDGRGSILPTDLKLGAQIEIYGKIFQLCKCDQFTKWFYGEAGLELGEECNAPTDAYTSAVDMEIKVRHGHFGIPRNVMEGKHYNELQLGGARGNNGLEQFLKNDGKVLRFYSYWDDHTRYGSRQYQVIQYFLADDSIQMGDQYPRNSGRHPFPTLFKRRKMEKQFKVNAVPGMLQKDPVYVMPQDLVCGQFLEVLGRAYFLYDCDDFTRDFYQTYMGVEQVAYPKCVEDDPIIHQKLTPPPHNGPGTAEDSLLNCIHLQPPVPKQDLVKLTTLDGKILRFEARCANYQVEDEDRKFIIGFFLANDTVACWELRQRNSGFAEGKFKERGRTKNPATGDYYKPQELYVGAEVAISCMPMVITRADEYTLKYMEENAYDFPMCDAGTILHKISDIKNDPEIRSANSFDPDSFRNVVEQKTGIYLVDQELITLLRRFGEASEEPKIGMEALLGSLS